MRAYTVLTSLLLLSEWWPGVVLGGNIYTVTEGKDVTAQCWFHWSGTKKIFCKNNCYKEEDILVETTGNGATKDRYSIRYEEETSIMTVSIKEAQLSDSGRYWCKLVRFIKNGYEEFEIKVNKAPSVKPPSPVVPSVITPRSTVTPGLTQSPGPHPDPSPSPRTETTHRPSAGSGETSRTSAPLLADHPSKATGSLLVVGLTLAVTVLLFILALLILYKKKRNKKKRKDNSMNTEPVVQEVDRENEEVPEQQVLSRPTDVSDIYSLASAPAHTQGDTVLYSEVNFNRKSAPRRPEEAVVYSTVQKEETLYSNVSER